MVWGSLWPFEGDNDDNVWLWAPLCDVMMGGGFTLALWLSWLSSSYT